jgi:hypothetical protein
MELLYPEVSFWFVVCAAALLGRGLAREEFTVRAARRTLRLGTYVSDGSFLVNLVLEILEDALVDHRVACGWFLAGKC